MGPEWMSLQVHLPRHIEMTVIPHFPVIQGFCLSWQARQARLAHHLDDAMVIISNFGHKSKQQGARRCISCLPGILCWGKMASCPGDLTVGSGPTISKTALPVRAHRENDT
jgi:hypothetical protein